MKKIEEIEMGTYAKQDIMTRSVNLWAKQNELIRAFNGLYDAVEALSHSIPPKDPTATISEIAKAEQRFQEMMNHFGKAIQLLRAIAHGEAPEGQPDLRKDPRYTFGGYSNVSLLAQVAIDELEKALALEETKK